MNERNVTIDANGVHVTGNNLPAFVDTYTVANDTTSYPTVTQMLTVQFLNQVQFSLASAPKKEAIKTVVLNRRTYFEPDFTVSGRTLTWNVGSLPTGTQLLFESFGTDQVHRRKDTLPVAQVGQTRFLLFMEPDGYTVELFLNGKFVPKTDFRIEGKYLVWQAGELNPSDKLVVITAITPPGAELYHIDNFTLNPTSTPVFQLNLDPPNAPRVYIDGFRYVSGTDFAITQDQVTITASLDKGHGGQVSIVSNTSTSYFPSTARAGRLPKQLFVKSNLIATGPSASLALPNPATNSILSVNGLVYAESDGYTRTATTLSWEDASLTLKAGDEFSLLGFMAPDAVEVKQFTGLTGYPTFNLLDKAADIKKSLVFVSASEAYGGELYMGRTYLVFPTERAIVWNGTFPLKATDRVVVVFLRAPSLATELTLETFQVLLAEEGLPYKHTLRRTPKEPSSVIVSYNGERLTTPKGFTVNDNVLQFHRPEYVAQAGDRFTVLYR